MFQMILRRLGMSVPLLFVVTFMTFLLNSLAPGDLARTMMQGEGTEAQYQALRAELGLDQPLVVRYGHWLVKALQGELGTSFFTKEPVVELLNSRIGVTLSLMAGVLIVVVCCGLALGTFSALRGGWVGRAIDTLSLVGLIFPSFWVALVFIALFAVTLRWLPATGYTPFAENPKMWLPCLLMPVLSVSMTSITSVAKQTRDSMNDVMGRDFIRSLRACGISEASIVWISPKGIATPDLLARQTCGAGPCKLDPAATVTGKTYTDVPNEHYYDKSRIKWDKVVMSVFEDQNSAIQAMKTGQLKLLVSDPVTGHANADKLSREMRIISDPVQWVGLIIIDRNGIVNPALKDVRVRQAINFAIDRTLVTRALLGKLADPTVQIQGRGFMGFDAANEAKYPCDPAKARALLAAAGYPNGVDLKVSYVNNTLSTTLTQVIAGQLKKVGFNVKTTELQNFGALNAAGAAKSCDALVFNTNSGVPNLAKFQTLDPKGSLNVYNSEDATLTRLIAEASALSIDKAEAAWKKVYAHVVDLAWFAPIAATHVVYFATDAVKLPKPGQTVVIDMVNVVPAK